MSRQALLQIYKLFSLWAEDFDFACQKGCSTCCTQSVSMTTLEGELIYDFIINEKPELVQPLDDLPTSSLNPKTTNQFAAACLQEKDQEDDVEAWNLTPCFFLQDECCAIYPVRSFMCRSLGSSIPCDKGGEAEMDPLFLTLNTVILQSIEHLDQGRPWGNMYTILKMIRDSSPEEGNGWSSNVRISEPIPGFLIPPEEAEQIQNQLQTLLKIIRAG